MGQKPKSVFHRRTPGAKIRDGEGLGPGHTTWPRGIGLVAPGGGLAALGTPSVSLFAYKLPLDLKTKGGSTFFQKEFRSAAATRNQDSDPESPFWYPAGTGNLERIIAIIITNVSPSTTDVSLNHE